MAKVGAALFALLLSSIALAAASRDTQVLMVSDLHFDPLADKSLVRQLIVAPVEQWAAILDTSADQAFSGTAHDANWPLMVSAFDAMKALVPTPAFALVTGDLLPHRFKENFQAATGEMSDAVFQSFVRKTAAFISVQFRARYPVLPVFLTPGNNDDDCGDYQARPAGPFFQDTLALMSGLGGSGMTKQFATDWAASGSYSVPNPAVPKYRIILPNTVYFSPRYKNACGDAGATPAADVMKWLRASLEQARAAHEKVWLAYHIPPGIDGFATQRRSATTECTASIVPMWLPDYSAAFSQLVSEYADTIVASFAGHTHMDDFRLVGNAYTLINPAVSPIFGQTPAFRTVQFRAGKPYDQTTYALGDAAGKRWSAEYSFRETWHMRNMDPRAVQNLHARIESNPKVREQWSRYFSVSSTDAAAVTPAKFKSVYCATGQLTVASYAACFCPGK